MVGTQIYIITQISTYNYMFRPCILAIVRLYYKLVAITYVHVCKQGRCLELLYGCRWGLAHIVQLLIKFIIQHDHGQYTGSKHVVVCTNFFFFRLFIPCIFCTHCNKVTNGCNCLFCVFISFINKGNKYTK